MEIVEQAQEADAAFRAQAITAQRGQGAVGRGVAECIDCGEEISEKRRAADVGAVRCIDCQTEYERSA